MFTTNCVALMQDGITAASTRKTRAVGLICTSWPPCCTRRPPTSGCRSCSCRSIIGVSTATSSIPGGTVGGVHGRQHHNVEDAAGVFTPERAGRVLETWCLPWVLIYNKPFEKQMFVPKFSIF